MKKKQIIVQERCLACGNGSPALPQAKVSFLRCGVPGFKTGFGFHSLLYRLEKTKSMQAVRRVLELEVADGISTKPCMHFTFVPCLTTSLQANHTKKAL